MKRSLAFFVLAAALLSVPAFADSIAVTGAAAMEGSFGMAVSHDNSSTAYVEDQTPDSEKVYRASFLFDPNDIASPPPGANVRQTIFTAISTNPNPGGGVCPASAASPTTAFRLFVYLTGGMGQNVSIQGFSRGNSCGEGFVPRIPITGPVKICAEWESIPGALAGSFSLAILSNQADPCPPSGDGAYSTVAMTNGNLNVLQVRLGTPQLNAFGAGETGTLYFDDFQSFRTLAP